MRIIQIITILAFTIWLQYLGFTGGLAFYIHPRYIDFSNIMSYIALLFVIVSLLLYFFKPGYTAVLEHSHDHMPIKNSIRINESISIYQKILGLFKNFKWMNLMLALVLILGLGLPVRALSSVTATVRGVGTNISISNSPAESKNPFLQPASESLDISDWLKQFVLEADVNVFKSKKVNMTGFVFLNPELLDLSNDQYGYFKISRFVITCCAVDARPVGVYVKFDKKYSEEIKSDQWLKIGGIFQIETISGVQVPVVNLTKLEKIKPPTNPYLY